MPRASFTLTTTALPAIKVFELRQPLISCFIEVQPAATYVYLIAAVNQSTCDH
jgi:hypothetical protein